MSIRTERIARMIQREVADVLNTEFSDASPALVTVTRARVTKDLSIAYVHLSVLGETTEQRQATFKRIQDATPQIRAALATRIRHQMRAIPELRLFIDESQHHAANIERLLDQIRQEQDARPQTAPEADDQNDAHDAGR